MEFYLAPSLGKLADPQGAGGCSGFGKLADLLAPAAVWESWQTHRAPEKSGEQAWPGLAGEAPGDLY